MDEASGWTSTRYVGACPSPRSVTKDNGRLTFDTTKTGEERTVPLPRFLAEQITASFAGKGPDDLVFQGTRGGVLCNRNFKIVQQMLRHAAGSV